MSDTVKYFEDIDIGDEIAELDIRPTTADVVRFCNIQWERIGAGVPPGLQIQ